LDFNVKSASIQVYGNSHNSQFDCWIGLKVYRVEKCGNKASTSTQDVRKVGAEPKTNSGNRAKTLRWADYEDFEEDVDDIGDGGFEDETIGYREGFGS
jgi:hypothetical protein